MVPPAALIELFEAVRTRPRRRSRTGRGATVASRRRPVVPLRALVPRRLGPRPRGRAHVPGRPHRGRGDARERARASGVVPDGVEIDVEAALPDEPVGHRRRRPRRDAHQGRRARGPPRRRRGRRGQGGRRATTTASVELVLGVASFASIRSWVLGLADHATVLEPAGVPRRARRLAEALADGDADGPAAARHRPLRRRIRWWPPRPMRAAPDAAAGARAAPGAETSRRLRRLLAVVGWLAQVGEAPIAEVAQRFGMSEQELVAELELAACCGTPPYTPDTLMEIEVSEHSVRAFLPEEYARPRPADAGRGLRRGGVGPPAAGGAGLRRRRLARGRWPSWRRRWGPARRSGSTWTRRPTWRRCARATDAGRAVEIDYLSGSRDELTTRVVEPVQVVTIDGHWYLDAYCHRAGDMRRFRVDRIGCGAGGAGRGRRRSAPTGCAGRGRRTRCSCPARAPSRCTCGWGRPRSGCQSRSRCGRSSATATAR